MRTHRALRMIMILTSGAFLLQAGGCDLAMINEFVQTVLLGITAAGAVAILQNI